MPWELLRLFTLLTVALHIIGRGALAQAGAAGEINGVIRDSSGAIVQGATVQVMNLITGAVRTVSTSSLGYYTVPLLPPGNYKIMVTMHGFATQTRPSVSLEVQQRLAVDFVIVPATQTNTVTVTEQTGPILTTNAHTGEVISQGQVVDLPLNGRQFSQLVLLAPGTSPESGAMQTAFLVQQGAGGVSPSVNGQSGRFNNYALDGINNEEEFTQRWAISPPPDAIQEFRSSGDQSYAGTSINIITKSGTNEVHGDVWEFFRNDALDARNTFDASRLPYRQNEYGFAAGAPLYVPKLINGRKSASWIFGYWEGFRSDKGLTTFGTVPTAAMRQGDLSSFLGPQVGTTTSNQAVFQGQIFNPYTTIPNSTNPAEFTRQPFPKNQIPLTLIGKPQLDYIAQFYPLPNQNGFPNNFVNTQPLSVATDQWGIRFDQLVRTKDLFFARVNVSHASQESPSSLPKAPNFTVNRNLAVAGSYTHTFSPTFVTNGSFGYTRDFTPYYNSGVSPQLQQELGMETLIPPYNYAGGIYLAQEAGIGPTFSTPSQLGWFVGGPDIAYQFSGAGTKVWGNHTVNFGIRVLRIRHTGDPQPSLSEGFSPLTTGAAGFAGTTGNTLASFLLGLPDTAIDFIIPLKDIHWTIYDPFVEDQWKVSPKLTINFGTHWTYFSGPYFLNDAISVFNVTTGQWQWGATNPITGEPPNLPRTLYSPIYHNFGPTAGVAYQMTSRTVLRSGFSMAYDHGSQVQAVQADLGNYPFGSRASVSNVNLITPSQFTFTNPLPPASSFGPTTTPAITTNPADGIPYVMQWNAGFQRQLTSDMVLSADYVGTAGRDIYMAYTYNTATTPGPGPLAPRQPYPQFGPFTLQTNRGVTNYNALQMMLRKRFAHGLTFQASYTWSKALGDTVFYGNLVQNPYDIGRAYGPLNYDVPQAFVLSWVYQLPFGHGRSWLSNSSAIVNALLGSWTTSGIISAYKGFPFTVTLPFDNANTGSSYQLANVVGTVMPPSFQPTREEWFNTAAFALPPQYTFGDAGNGIVRGPGTRDIDLSIYKDFHLSESRYFQFRCETFNLFNFTNLGMPDSTIDTPNFGRILSASAAREIQFALKFIW